MKKGTGITETEWQVMTAVWEKEGMTIGEIREALSGTGWSDSTVKTLVRRLAEKGVLRIDGETGHFRYFSAVCREECSRRETRGLINRIYNGSVKMLMASLAADSKLSDEETRQLMEIINKMDDGGQKDETAD